MKEKIDALLVNFPDIQQRAVRIMKRTLYLFILVNKMQ